MIKNYVIIAVRNLLRHKSYSLISISGLSVGMTCCMLILLFIQYEFSHDRHHTKADRIYKVLRKKQRPDGEKYHMASTLGPVAPTMKKDFPEVENATRFINRPMLVGYDNKKFTQRVLLTDREFLNVFDYPLIKGNKADLDTPYTVFITQAFAKKLFGDADPIGKTISIDYKWVEGNFTIAGILQDIPESCIWVFDCDLLTTTTASTNVTRFENETWENYLWDTWAPESRLHPMMTYVLLKPNASASALSQKLPAFALQYLGEEVGQTEGHVLAPLNRFYLYGLHDYPGLTVPKEVKPLGDYRKSYTFGVIGFFVIIIACINFMNLATARSSRRAREVGMRKVVGAERTQIAHQFLGESILLALIAMAIAFVCTKLLLPIVSGHLNIPLIMNTSFLLGLIGLAFIVGLVAGSYPAFYLSSFHPTAVLSSTSNIKGGHAIIRKGLVIVQFAISIVLIVGTLVANQQTEFMRNTDVGFNRDARLVIPFNRQQDRDVRNRAPSIKERAAQHPAIQGAALSIFPPGWEGDINMSQVSAKGLPESIDVHMLYADHDFLDVYGITLAAGRQLREEDRPRPTEGEERPQVKALLNETGARALGNVKPGDYVGVWGMQVQVVGIFNDFHNRSLHYAVRPLMLTQWNSFDYLTVHFNTKQLPAVMTHLEGVFKEAFPGRPFEYQFLDSYLDEFYRTELKLRQLYTASTGLAIFIACLGLLGLIAYTAEVRTREIGVRKVLGASEWGLVGLLTREFLILVGFASLLAWPIAWFAMSSWLQNFAYRIDMNPIVLVASTIAALIITLLTISYQALKAARANPVDALRNE